MNLHIRRIIRIVFALAIITSAVSVAVGQTDNGALDKDGVKKTIAFMKQTGSSDQDIAGVVSRTGVNFHPSAQDEKELREAGASDAVMAAVRNSYQGQEAANDAPKEEPNNPPKEENNAAQENTNQRAKNNKQQKQPKNPPAKTDEQAKTEQTDTNQPAERPAEPTADQKNLIFKVGDRVEVDVTQFMPPNKKWYKATIVKVNTNALGDLLDYDVKLDTVDGSEVIRDHIPKRPNWIRPLK